MVVFFNFASEYGITRDKRSQDGLKLKGAHHLVVYADDDNGCEHTYYKEKHRSFTSC
jgi:hypothetical protein